MSDIFSKAKRSAVMARIRSKGNASTELRAIDLFKELNLTGWRRNYKLAGKPDFVFPRIRTAVFIDGCFWHQCPRCGLVPKQNSEFWSTKLSGNRDRDRTVTTQLRRSGWRVIRIWEHELSESLTIMRKLKTGGLLA